MATLEELQRRLAVLQNEAPDVDNLIIDGDAEGEELLALRARLAELEASDAPDFFDAPPREDATDEAPETVTALDMERGSTLKRTMAGLLRPVHGAGELLVKAVNASQPATDFFGVDPVMEWDAVKAVPDLFNEETWDAGAAEFSESRERGRRRLAAGAKERYAELAAANEERSKLPFEERTWDNSNNLERLGARINTGWKGEGNWDTAGMVGQISASIPAIALAGPSFVGQALAGAGAGLLTPTGEVSSEDFYGSKSAQTAVGFLGGAAGVGLAKIWSVAGPHLRLLVGDSKKLTRELIRGAIRDEDKAEAIIIKLEADMADPPLALESAGEVAADVGSPQFSAVSENVETLFPNLRVAREADQIDSRGQVLDDIIDAGPPAVAVREATTKPVREEVLGLAETNSVGMQALQIAQDQLKKQRADRFGQQQKRADRGGSINSPVDQRNAAIDILEKQLQVYRDKSITPATMDTIFKGLRSYGKGSKVVGNPAAKQALAVAQRELAQMRRPDGTIDPVALYTYRKTGLDEAIKRELSPDGNYSSLSAGVLDAVTTAKALIDDTIEGALGNTKGWTKGYLELYSKLSPPINQAQVARVLKKSLTQEGSPGQQTPRMLAKAMDAEEVAVKEAKKAGGFKGDTFEEVFDPQQVQLLDELRAGVGRTVRNEQLAATGSATVREATQADKPQIGNALIREIMIANKLFQNMAAFRQKEITNHIEELFTRDPRQGYQMLINALKDARPAVKKSLLDKAYAALTGATVTTVQKTARGALPLVPAAGIIAGVEGLIDEE